MKGIFDTLNDISENVTFLHLIDSILNFNHTVSIVGKWILDSKIKRYFWLLVESLNFICSFSDR